jgi:hypothetical protein
MRTRHARALSTVGEPLLNLEFVRQLDNGHYEINGKPLEVR